MHVLATALFDRPAFRNCVSHGILLGSDGRKMSKSLRNYPDVYEMFDAYGSDAMRWMLMSSPVLRGGDMPVTERASATRCGRCCFRCGTSGTSSRCTPTRRGRAYEAKLVDELADLLDRYVLAKTGELVARGDRPDGRLRHHRRLRRRCGPIWTR